MQQNHAQPQWQPLSVLPTLGPQIDGMLEAAEENYEALQEARPKPHVLDDATIKRVRQVYTAQRDDLGLFDEQLRRWGTEPKLTSAQRTEIGRLKWQMSKLRQTVTAILALADELGKGTIEQFLGMSDLDVGLKALLGELPGQPHQQPKGKGV